MSESGSAKPNKLRLKATERTVAYKNFRGVQTGNDIEDGNDSIRGKTQTVLNHCREGWTVLTDKNVVMRVTEAMLLTEIRQVVTVLDTGDGQYHGRANAHTTLERTSKKQCRFFKMVCKRELQFRPIEGMLLEYKVVKTHKVEHKSDAPEHHIKFWYAGMDSTFCRSATFEAFGLVPDCFKVASPQPKIVVDDDVSLPDGMFTI